MTHVEIKNRISELQATAKKFQASQYRSSQMHDARGVFSCERELEKIWAEIDSLRNALKGPVLAYTLPLETLLAAAKQ